MGVLGEDTVSSAENCMVQGERRVSDLECHVRCLRNKLCRLEIMLSLIETSNPKADGLGSAFLDDQHDQENENKSRFLNRLWVKENILKRNIHDLENTGNAFSLTPLDNKEIQSLYSPKSTDHEEVRDCLGRLETCGKKLCRNLRGDRCDLTRQAIALSKELDKTRATLGLSKHTISSDSCSIDKLKNEIDNLEREFENVKERKGYEKEQHLEDLVIKDCCCGEITKCENCIVWSCAEWERELKRKGVEETESLREILSILNPKLKPSLDIHQQETEICSYDDILSEVSDQWGSAMDNLSTVNFESTITSSSSSGVEFERYENSFTSISYDVVYKVEELKRFDDAKICDQEHDTRVFGREERCRGGVDIIVTGTETKYNNYIQHQSQFGHNQYYNALDLESSEKIRRFKECMKNFKTRNQTLRKLLKRIETSQVNIDKMDIREKISEPKKIQSATENSELSDVDMDKMLTMMELLEYECRSKDQMIAALADELRCSSSMEQKPRILGSLTGPNEHSDNTRVFGQFPFWNYLRRIQNVISTPNSFPTRLIICAIFFFSFIFLISNKSPKTLYDKQMNFMKANIKLLYMTNHFFSVFTRTLHHFCDASANFAKLWIGNIYECICEHLIANTTSLVTFFSNIYLLLLSPTFHLCLKCFSNNFVQVTVSVWQIGICIILVCLILKLGFFRKVTKKRPKKPRTIHCKSSRRSKFCNTNAINENQRKTFVSFLISKVYNTILRSISPSNIIWLACGFAFHHVRNMSELYLAKFIRENEHFQKIFISLNIFSNEENVIIESVFERFWRTFFLSPLSTLYNCIVFFVPKSYSFLN